MHLIKQTIQQRIKQLNNQSFPSNQFTQQSIKIRQKMLLKMKKNESLRELKQIHFFRVLCCHKTFNQQSMKQFYELSKNLMSNYNSKIIQQLIQSDQIINDLVFLYIKFFQQFQCQQKAQSILNIYKKKLCTDDVLLATMLNWFVEWTRYRYKQQLKKLLKEFNQISAKYNSKLINKSDINQSKNIQQVATQQIVSHQQRQNLTINKELLLGSFINQLTDIYKLQNSVLIDLDINYIKSLKKFNHKNYIIKNIDRVSYQLVNMIFQQNKKCVNQYKNDYCNKFPEYNNFYKCNYKIKEDQFCKKKFNSPLKTTYKKIKTSLSNNFPTLKSKPHANISFYKNTFINFPILDQTQTQIDKNINLSDQNLQKKIQHLRISTVPIIQIEPENKHKIIDKQSRKSSIKNRSIDNPYIMSDLKMIQEISPPKNINLPKLRKRNL